MAVRVKSALAAYVNLEVVLVFVLGTDKFKRNCPHLFLKKDFIVGVRT